MEQIKCSRDWEKLNVIDCILLFADVNCSKDGLFINGGKSYGLVNALSKLDYLIMLT